MLVDRVKAEHGKLIIDFTISPSSFRSFRSKNNYLLYKQDAIDFIFKQFIIRRKN